jgi:hypothetical protein
VFKDLRGLRDRARVGASINRYTTQKKKSKKKSNRSDRILCVHARALVCSCARGNTAVGRLLRQQVTSLSSLTSDGLAEVLGGGFTEQHEDFPSEDKF